MPQQVRYTDAEVEQIKTLFPDVDSLKLYRKYLLDLPLTKIETARVKSLWGSEAVRSIIQKVTLPLIDGNEPVGIGYDLLNNVSLKETDFKHQERHVSLFLDAIEYLQSRIDGLDAVSKVATGTHTWLTAATIKERLTTNEVLEQLCIKQNVEGILLGLQAVINLKTETPEEKAARETADGVA